MTKIYNKLPQNIDPKYVHLFKNKQTYTSSPLKTKTLKNVFVSHWGLLIKNYLMPLKSAENLLGFYDQSFYFQHYKKAIEQYLVSKYGKSLPSIILDDSKEYFTIHTPWFGYFSWFTTNLPRLIKVHNKNPQAILLITEEINRFPFVKESLKLFPNLERLEVKDGHHMFVKNFVFAQVRPWTSQFEYDDLQLVRNQCFNFIDSQKQSNISMQLVYVSRRKAKRRNITNETEVEEYLQTKGFTSICFEDYSVFEQIAIMRQAKVFISLHGAGLTNTIFMSPNTTVLELSPIPDKDNQFRFPFWRICDLLQVSYSIQFCQTINKGEVDIYTRDVTVDMELFKLNCNQILYS